MFRNPTFLSRNKEFSDQPTLRLGGIRHDINLSMTVIPDIVGSVGGVGLERPQVIEPIELPNQSSCQIESAHSAFFGVTQTMRFIVALFVVSVVAGSSSAADKIDIPAADAAAIELLGSAGAQVLTLFQDSPLLRVSFTQRDEPAGDAEVVLLSGVAQQVVDLNLAKSGVTDSGAAPLATFKNLATLHLEQTGVGDDALSHLASLKNLEYLNLYGTKVTDAGLTHLEGLAKLKKLYLWQTAVSYDAARKLEASVDGLVVNIGWDHPEVKRRRLTKQLEEVTARKDEAIKRADAAAKEKDAAVAREAEIQKELAALNPKEETPAKEDAAEKKPEEKKEETPAEEKPAEEKKE